MGTVSTPAATHIPAKRIITLGIAVTLALSAICAQLLLDSYGRDYEKTRAANENLVVSVQSEIARGIQTYDLSLQAVIDGLALPPHFLSDPELRQAILFDRAATAPDLGSIFVLDRIGRVVVESRSLTPRPGNFSDREYFRYHKGHDDMGRYISGPWRNSRGEYVIGISRRLNDKDGSFKGVVAGTISLGYFHRLFKNLNVGPDDTFSLFRSDGTVLMRAPFDINIIGQNFSHTELFAFLKGKNAGSTDFKSAIDGKNRLFVFKQVGDEPLYLTAGTAHSSIYAAWWRQAYIIGTITFALSAILMALVVFLARALKARAAAEHQLSVLSQTDSLTGLANRRFFDEQMTREWSRSQREALPLSVLMIDADFFKIYNDTNGHQAGDAALIVLAACIRESARRPFDLCARYGGEEFIVLLPGIGMADAARVAEAIRLRVLLQREAPEHEGAAPVPTVSIGVASTIPNGGNKPFELIKAADLALYGAKSEGRNCVVRAQPRAIKLAA